MNIQRSSRNSWAASHPKVLVTPGFMRSTTNIQPNSPNICEHALRLPVNGIDSECQLPDARLACPAPDENSVQNSSESNKSVSLPSKSPRIGTSHCVPSSSKRRMRRSRSRAYRIKQLEPDDVHILHSPYTNEIRAVDCSYSEGRSVRGREEPLRSISGLLCAIFPVCHRNLRLRSRVRLQSR